VGEPRQLARKYHKRFCRECSAEIPYPPNPGTLELENWNRRTRCDDCKRHKRLISESFGTCAICDETKPIGDFPSGNKKSKSEAAYKYAYCKECHSERERSRRLFALYRITAVEYDTILVSQGGCCAICKRPPAKNRLAVDHDHKTGLIRGLLCWVCNRALGLLRDRLASAEALVEYLTDNPAERSLGVKRFGLIGKAQFKKKMVYGSANGPLEQEKVKSKARRVSKK
jgi:hypothetical protein